jgi:hypothetical protein
LSPDGKAIVYAANQQLYLRTMDSLESHAIPGTREGPVNPFFSPDGLQVGYSSGGQLKRIAVSGGAPTTIASANFTFPTPNWETDDTIVWSQAEGVMRVSAKGGTPGDPRC